MTSENDTLNQTSSGNRNQFIQFNGKNTGNINQTHIAVTNTVSESVADYSQNVETVYNSIYSFLLQPWKILSFISSAFISIGAQYLSPSVNYPFINWLRSTLEIPIFKFDSNDFLAGSLNSLMSLSIILPSLAFPLFFLFILTEPVFTLIFKKRTRFLFKSYLLKKDKTITCGKIIAECPIHTCSGTLVVKPPFRNEQHVRLAGVCNRAPTLHIFGFDPITMKGERLYLTPKIEKQKQEQTSYRY